MVAVSGYETLSARALEAGIEHYLVKPVDPRLLRTLLLHLVEQRTDARPRHRLPPDIR